MMTMQRRRQHGSSGELDVFGATSYFAAGLPADYCRPSGPADRRLMIQFHAANNQVTADDTRMMEDEQQLGLHGDEGQTQLGLGVVKPSGNSKLAALLRIFMASPSQRASRSFRKEPPPPPSPRTDNKLPAAAAAAGDEPANKASSSSSSSRELQVVIDLGVATGDRRLQGVRVVRPGSGDGERWVVRCGSWEDAESGGGDPKDEVEEGEGGNKPAAGGWESDSSSDLFDLDIE